MYINRINCRLNTGPTPITLYGFCFCRSVSPGWNNLSTIYLDGQAHMSYRHRDSVCIVSKDENAMLHHLMVKSKDVVGYYYSTLLKS